MALIFVVLIFVVPITVAPSSAPTRWLRPARLAAVPPGMVAVQPAAGVQVERALVRAEEGIALPDGAGR